MIILLTGMLRRLSADLSAAAREAQHLPPAAERLCAEALIDAYLRGCREYVAEHEERTRKPSLRGWMFDESAWAQVYDDREPTTSALWSYQDRLSWWGKQGRYHGPTRLLRVLPDESTEPWVP